MVNNGNHRHKKKKTTILFDSFSQTRGVGGVAWQKRIRRLCVRKIRIVIIIYSIIKISLLPIYNYLLLFQVFKVWWTIGIFSWIVTHLLVNTVKEWRHVGKVSQQWILLHKCFFFLKSQSNTTNKWHCSFLKRILMYRFFKLPLPCIYSIKEAKKQTWLGQWLTISNHVECTSHFG